MTASILDVTSAATTALLTLSAVCEAHPEIEIPARIRSGLARIALKRPVPTLPALARAKRRKKNGHSHPRVEALLRASAWDPDPPSLEPIDALREATCCRALLLEVVRRAAYDWVLYRLSSNLAKKRLAQDAHHWLFVDRPNSAAWRERVRSEKEITAFGNICELLDLDPEHVRAHVRKLTTRDVMSVGRPAERRHPVSEESMTGNIEMHLNLDYVPAAV